MIFKEGLDDWDSYDDAEFEDPLTTIAKTGSPTTKSPDIPKEKAIHTSAMTRDNMKFNISLNEDYKGMNCY